MISTHFWRNIYSFALAQSTAYPQNPPIYAILNTLAITNTTVDEEKKEGAEGEVGAGEGEEKAEDTSEKGEEESNGEQGE